MEFRYRQAVQFQQFIYERQAVRQKVYIGAHRHHMKSKIAGNRKPFEFK
jgi:hypothetical protein